MLWPAIYGSVEEFPVEQLTYLELEQCPGGNVPSL